MTAINPTPDVSSRYGAPMGRYTGPNYLEVNAAPWHLQRIRLDSGGYDSGGAYWGHGQPLYFVQDQDGNSQFMRAADRSDAKRKLTDKWPGCRFFR